MPRPPGPRYKPPSGYRPLDEEELKRYTWSRPHFFIEQRRKSWALQLAERHRLVPIRSSVFATNCLVQHLLPDLFPHWYRPGQYTRDMSDLDLALSTLGETRVVKVRTEKGLPPTLRVEASSRAEAIEHLANLGIEPVKPL
ncbi:MAG: hypothetical protein AAFO80_08285 [Pseudomonadota bacterium]